MIHSNAEQVSDPDQSVQDECAVSITAQQAGNQPPEVGGFPYGECLDQPVKEHGPTEEQQQGGAGSDPTKAQKRNTFSQKHPGTARTDWKLLPMEEETAIWTLMAAQHVTDRKEDVIKKCHSHQSPKTKSRSGKPNSVINRAIPIARSSLIRRSFASSLDRKAVICAPNSCDISFSASEIPKYVK